jgi:hypothetical protein
MRDIAKLLFGGEDGADVLGGLFAPGDGNDFEMADRARRAGEWCGTTPGRGSAEARVADAVFGPWRHGPGRRRWL